jgi:hypothetical protein
MNQAEYRIALQSKETSLFAKVTLSASLTNEQNGLNVICESVYGKEWLSVVNARNSLCLRANFSQTEAF